MRSTNPPILAAVCLAMSLVLPMPGHASVMALASMKIFDLDFSSTDPAAELNWFEEDGSDPFSGWHGQITVQAQDTLTGTVGDSTEVYGDNEHIERQAKTALVQSDASYTVTNGPGVAKGTGSVEVDTKSSLQIDDPTTAQASGDAGGVMDNIFWITGGTAGDPVDVTFTLDYEYTLNASAEANGYFKVYVYSILQIEDWDDMFGDIDNVDDFIEDHFLRVEEGSDTGIHVTETGILTLDATLEYEKDYFLWGGADSEVYGTNVPGPATWLLVLCGGGLLLSRRRGDRQERS